MYEQLDLLMQDLQVEIHKDSIPVINVSHSARVILGSRVNCCANSVSTIDLVKIIF